MSTKRIAAGLAAAAGIVTLGLTGPAAAATHTDTAGGSDVTVTKGAYKAVFHHTGKEGETLQVYDNATDGDAAVAYVRMRLLSLGNVTDKDRLVVTNGYHNFNLREGDSGKYDIPEGREVDVMICRGYASIPGDNCSDWKAGVS
ncbi:MAG TPA: hypothetical protein VHC49_09380 [Mycobacteriales bacterium]|nr:hypothetical protein [Mycobacteriales bacterium]